MAKNLKQHVIAFRMTHDEFEAFSEAQSKERVVGVRSAGTYIRKLALDFAYGKLAWKDESDRYISPDVAKAAADALAKVSRSPAKRARSEAKKATKATA